MDIDLTDLEQSFRQSWRSFSPQRYTEYLQQAAETKRLELLARLLSVELEFAFQPPSANSSTSLSPAGDDDQRVKPCVTLFLLRFPELASRSDLVIRLIVLEYALRLRFDKQPPNPVSYLPLCQQETEQLVRLLELTESKLPLRNPEPSNSQEIKHSDSTVKESTASLSASLEPLQLNLGCFLLLRMLGRGGMGYVHAAIDLRSTAQVAVKVMRRIDAWSIYRFIEEFRWLSQLSHPNLVKLYDAFCDGDIRYFSMELVEGTTIREWFKRRADPDKRWDELRKVLGQLASAVEYLHQHGVLHCDIKCSNMMIASKRRAVLLDLGLAIRTGNQNRMVGTLQYMAPEIIRGGSPTYATDWYSFGVMIYEVVTDNFPPIQINLVAEGEAKSYEINFEQLRLNLQNCPVDISSLCIDLMQLSPSERPSGAEIVTRLNGRTTPGLIATCVDGSEGRQDELKAIESAVRSTKTGGAKLIFLQGESGIGKTTLMQHSLKSIVSDNCLLLSVKCYRQDHTPVRLLNALVQEMTSALQNLPHAKWMPQLEKRLDEIRQLFPQVLQLIPGYSVSTKPSERKAADDSLRDISISSFVDWLQELSKQHRLMITVDDAQWADMESLRTLKRLLSHAGVFNGTLLLVDESDERRLPEIFRQDGKSTVADQSLFEVTQVPLRPLNQETCERVLARLANSAQVPLAASVASDIASRSSGNPFLLQEIFRTYLHSVYRRDVSDAEWLIDDSQSSVRRRFSTLPQQTESVLQFLAVSDQSMTFHQLQMVSRILPHELQRELSLLASQGWIRSRGSEFEADVEIAHENFRRAILQSIQPERLQRRHYRMARILSSETPPPWARIARHYWSAERFREAATCYLEAARSAMATSDSEETLEFLQRACHPDAERTAAEQQRVIRMMADCLARLGSSRASAELYDQLLDTEEDVDQATILRCLSGEQWIRAGHLEHGLTRLKTALADLGMKNWKRTAFSFFCLSCRTLRLGSLPPQRHRTSRGSHAEAFNEMERCLNRLSPPLTFLDNQLGPDLILRMTHLAETSGSDFDNALAQCRAGILLSFTGRRLRHKAIERFRMGRKLARLCRSDEAKATADFTMFIWHVQRGHMATATKFGQRALSRYHNCPAATQWEQQFLKWALLGTQWYRGRLRELDQSASELRQSAHERSDPMSMYWTHVDSAHIADLILDTPVVARASLSIAKVAIASQTFQSPRFFLWLSRIRQALYENNATEAIAILRADWQHINQSVVMHSSHYRWLALTLRGCCDLLAIRNNLKNPASFLRDARQAVQQLLGLKEPVFVTYGEAFSLAVEATAGNVADMPVWQAVIDRLFQQEHELHGFALQWQYESWRNQRRSSQIGLELPGLVQHRDLRFRDLPRNLQGDVFSSHLRAEGCIAPEKLMNLVLPLPSLSAE